jgi:hypothetical protein
MPGSTADRAVQPMMEAVVGALANRGGPLGGVRFWPFPLPDLLDLADLEDLAGGRPDLADLAGARPRRVVNTAP